MSEDIWLVLKVKITTRSLWLKVSPKVRNLVSDEESYEKTLES